MLSTDEYENLKQLIEKLQNFSEEKIVQKNYQNIKKIIAPLLLTLNAHINAKAQKVYSHQNEDGLMTIMTSEIKNFLAMYYCEKNIEKKLDSLSELALNNEDTSNFGHTIKNLTTAFTAAQNELTETYLTYFDKLKTVLNDEAVLALMISRLFPIWLPRMPDKNDIKAKYLAKLKRDNSTPETFDWKYTKRQTNDGKLAGPTVSNLTRQFNAFYTATYAAIQKEKHDPEISGALLCDITLTMEIFALAGNNITKDNDIKVFNKKLLSTGNADNNLQFRLKQEILRPVFQREVIASVVGIPDITTFSLRLYDKIELAHSINNNNNNPNYIDQSAVFYNDGLESKSTDNMLKGIKNPSKKRKLDEIDEPVENEEITDKKRKLDDVSEEREFNPDAQTHHAEITNADNADLVTSINNIHGDIIEAPGKAVKDKSPDEADNKQKAPADNSLFHKKQSSVKKLNNNNNNCDNDTPANTLH